MKKVRVSFDVPIPLSSSGTHKAILLTEEGEHKTLESEVSTIVFTALSKMRYGDVKEITITKIDEEDII